MTTKVMNGLDLQSQRIQNLGASSVSTDAVNKAELDAAIRGLDWKQEVVAASVGTVTLATPGTTLDGITLVANDRVLLKDQTAPAENGIYVWLASGTPLTRALDADVATELSGATVTVQRGTVNADRVYRATADDPITLGTTAIPWAQVGSGGTGFDTAGTGLTNTGTTVNVIGGTGIIANANDVAVDTAVVVRKFAVSIGNGALTSIPVTHNLGTRDITWECYDSATFADVWVDAVRTDANTLTLTFATAPASNAYRVVVHA